MSSKSLPLPVVILALATLTACGGVAVHEPSITEVENNLLPFTIIENEPGFRLADRMVHYNVPGVSIAVIKDAGVLWVKHYGVTDVRNPEPVNDSTMFNVGSMSKAVTSAVILSLARDNLVDLEAPINDQLRSWTLPENEFTSQAPVTPLRLLNHSGGVVFSPGFPYPTESLPTLPQLLEGLPPARTAPIRVDRVPGTTFQYSNPGYTVLRQLAEDVTGTPFAEVAAKRVFEPLGMSHSTFVVPLPPALLAHAAMGHRTDGAVDAGYRRWVGHIAAGGLWTSAADYATFVVELQRALRGESSRLMGRDFAELMVEPHDAPEYGLGVFIRAPRGDRRYVGHIGDGPGFVGGFTTDDRGEYGVVVLTNGQGGINLIREIRRAVASVYDWPDNLPPAHTVVTPDSALVEQVAGRYRLGFDQVVTVDRSNDELWLRLQGQPPFKLFGVGGTTFVCRERAGEITIVRGSEGEVTHISFHLSDDMGRLGEEARLLPRMATGERTPLELLLDGGTTEATDLYRALLESDPAAPAVAENRLNGLGYQYLFGGRSAEAVAVFRLYAALYPDSANAYDSLGEGLMKDGQPEAAIASYRRSLELNPGNENAVAMIKKIENSS